LRDVVDHSLANLLQRVRIDRGLDLSGYKEAFVLRRLQSRLRILELDNIDEYCFYLRKHPDEYIKLLDVLAINVTEFFRDPRLFKVLSSTVIPELCRMHEREPVAKVLRFLSAGGASGEEAYSLAITLSETLGDLMSKYTVSIKMVDIDQDCLNKARAAVYAPDRLKNVPHNLLTKYFTPEDRGLYRVKPEITKLVKSYRMDLITEKLPKYFDMILCRNVLIYFSKDSHGRIFSKLHSSISSGGFLVLGRTETLMGVNKALFDTFDAKERIYRRRELHQHIRQPAGFP
jgi:chemotaxis methyl-accepting protein methylase